ncbi:Pfs, NACHT and WD domain protein [Aspergillus vadensis CBS 113365]|uniref:Pfs, NACHT and WD domain protein n=1 Tax=Aspergillus vadensis (strain CBS 113365 / IMI 142717 / IBT 24658) TaxID=1448311 RepID=A0A319CHL1_ASPVC|nr:Pfs, NACHT and WD domain protein [Aspergillus vadensis CBS 113365]PYH67712.1 Pfs, NACHT and WD domain protein [Aspergillus vadensis CBS 113365]
MYPSMTGFRARVRQKLEAFRGGKPRKQSTQVEGPHTKNDSISPTQGESEYHDTARIVEENGHVPPSGATQQEKPEANEHALHHLNQKVTSTECLTTIHNTLWNKAYNNLMQDPKKAKYVQAYEKLVLAVFLETPIFDVAGEGISPRLDLGEERMRAIVARALERVEDNKNVIETMNDVSGVLTQVKAFLDIPLQSIPQTALPWAVICSTIDILVRPAKAAADLYNGVAYVVSRMSWYSKAVDKLLSDQNIKNNTSLGEMNHSLETGIVDLYESMLFYQIKSVCFYYKSQLLVLLRGFLDLDDWSGNLNAVKDAEKVLQSDFTLYNQEHIKDQIRQITIASEHQKKLDEYRNCLQSLRWIDPRAEIGDIQARNESIIEELYTWILLTDEYRQFSKWDHITPARLWMLEDKSLKRAIIIIDAMDECEDQSRELLTKFIDDASSAEEMFNIKWLVSSRPLPEIPASVQDPTLPAHRLLKLDGHDMSHSIDKYIDIKMVQLRHKARKKNRVEEIAAKLKAEASNTYIWVSLVCRELINAHEFMWAEIVDRIPKDLEDLYGYLLDRLANLNSKIMSSCCRNVLMAAMLARDPLALSEIEILAELPEGEDTAEAVVQECRSFLTIRNNTVYLVHQSAQDYLQKHYRRLYNVSSATLHHQMYKRALHGLRKNLKQNIYGVSHYGIAIKDVQIPSPDPLNCVRYACRYWVYHLVQSGCTSTDMEDILSFFNTHFLHWLEAMSLLGLFPDTVRLVGQLKSISETENVPALLDFLMDAERFILQNLPIATAAPLQLYVSCLIYSPERSIVRCMFGKKACKWILRTVGADMEWGALLQTLEHSHRVCSVAFSTDGQLVASGSSDKTVKVWDTLTGNLQKIIDHTGWVRAVAFSPDNKLLASGLSDGTIRLWDTISWRETGRLEQSGDIAHLMFSLNNQLLGSASFDGVVKVWEKGTWRLRWEWRPSGQTSSLARTAFSLNGQVLVAATIRAHAPKIVALVNIETDTTVHELAHLGRITNVAFSPDNRMLACTSDDRTITLWDTATWNIKHTIHDEHVLDLTVFSPDSNFISAGPLQNSVQLWSTKSGTLEHTLKGHADYATTVAFSPNGQLVASGSHDKTVKLWKVTPGKEESSLDYHSEPIEGVILSPDGRLVATYSLDSTVKLWGAENGKLVRTLKGHHDEVTAAAFSPGSKLLASSSSDRTVRVWDTENGQQKWKFDHGSKMLCLVYFFAENQVLATDFGQNTFQIWNTETGHPEQTGGIYDPRIRSILRTNPTKQDMSAKCKISVEDDWVILNNKKSIWLPPEYRNNVFDDAWATRENALIIGAQSGRVYFVWLDPDALRDV